MTRNKEKIKLLKQTRKDLKEKANINITIEQLDLIIITHFQNVKKILEDTENQTSYSIKGFGKFQSFYKKESERTDNLKISDNKQFKVPAHNGIKFYKAKKQK